MRVFVYLAAALLAYASPAVSQEAAYPSKPVHIMLGFGPGSALHTFTSLVADKLSKRIGQPVILEHYVGGKGIPLMNRLKSSPADGYRIAVLTGSHAAATWIDGGIPYDLKKDFKPVMRYAQFPNLIATAADSPFKSLGDFIATAKAKPGSLNVGTMAVGSSDYLTADLLSSKAGVRFQIVPYGKEPQQMIPDALRGEMHIIIQNYVTFEGMLRDGKLRALAVTTASRSPHFPEIPTVQEAGIPDIDTRSWQGFYVPHGTPDSVIAYFAREMTEVMKDPELVARVAKLGVEFWPSSPEELTRTMAEDIDLQGDVIKRAGLLTR